MVFAVWPRPSGGAQGTVIGHGCLPPTPRACSLAWEIQLSVTAQAGVSGVSQAVSSQCKGMAEAEAGSPGEADCKPSRGNGSSLLAVMLVPGLQLPAASDPHLPFTTETPFPGTLEFPVPLTLACFTSRQIILSSMYILTHFPKGEYVLHEDMDFVCGHIPSAQGQRMLKNKPRLSRKPRMLLFDKRSKSC